MSRRARRRRRRSVLAVVMRWLAAARQLPMRCLPCQRIRSHICVAICRQHRNPPHAALSSPDGQVPTAAVHLLVWIPIPPSAEGVAEIAGGSRLDAVDGHRVLNGRIRINTLPSSPVIVTSDRRQRVGVHRDCIFCKCQCNRSRILIAPSQADAAWTKEVGPLLGKLR